MGIGAGLDGYGKTQPIGFQFPALNRQNLILNNRKSSKTSANRDAREGVLGIYSAKNPVDVNEKKII